MTTDTCIEGLLMMLLAACASNSDWFEVLAGLQKHSLTEKAKVGEAVPAFHVIIIVIAMHYLST
jgi:hypothetical protein